MAKVLVNLPDEFLVEVDKAAQSEHRTRSSLIREALRRYLANTGIEDIQNKRQNDFHLANNHFVQNQ